MKLEFIKEKVDKNLSDEKKKKIDVLIAKYLEETSSESIANEVTSTFQEVRKNFQFQKIVMEEPDDLWNEAGRFWFEMYLSFPDIRGKIPYDETAKKVSKSRVAELLGANYNNIKPICAVAGDISLGGIPEIIEKVFFIMQEDAIERYLNSRIWKYFEEYEYDPYAVQYIALKYLNKYKPETELTQSKNVQFFGYHTLYGIYGLDKLLKLHAKK